MRALIFGAALALGACGGKSADTTTDPCADPCKGKQAAMTCAQMASSVGAGMRASGDMADDMIAEMEGIFATRCGEDAWSQEAIDCMAAAESEEAGNACMETHMSADQASALNAAYEGAGGAGMEDGMDPESDDEGME